MIYIFDAISPETACYAHDYPWGFRLRTQQRYWIESKPKYGQRLCSQTLSQKTDKWCAVKYSVYSDIVVLSQDENGHYGTNGASRHTRKETLLNFIDRLGYGFDDFQKEQAKMLLAWVGIMEKVEFKIVPGEPVNIMHV